MALSFIIATSPTWEADMIISLNNGKWEPLEVKTRPSLRKLPQICSGLKNKINKDKMELSFLYGYNWW